MNISLNDRILDSVPSASGDAVPELGPPASQFEKRMTDFYMRVDAAVASHSPICRNRGLCCRFASFGHRLYVTEPERAYFAGGLAAQWRPVVPDQADCPYHVGGVCTARTHRPLGCRVFFCDDAAQEWQGPVYERFMAELKQIGQEFGLPYAYREWLSALRNGESVAADSA